MDRSNSMIVVLALLAAALTAVAAASGLFWPDGGGATHEVATLRGGTARLYGQGLYRHDTVFSGAGFRGQDAVVLLLAAPSTAIAAWAFWSGSRRAGLVLTATLAYLLYVAASMALGAAFNPLFLLYVAGFSASLFALILLMARLGAGPFPPGLPRRGPGLYMLAAGLGTSLIWLSLLLPDMLAGRPPPLLDSYTTFVTYALDLAVIGPASVASGILILRGRAMGVLMAVPLIGIILFLAPSIALATWFQARAGIRFAPAEIVGPIAAFLILGALGAWVLWAILRRAPDRAAPGPQAGRGGSTARR